MNELPVTLCRFIDRQLNSMISRPDSWGSAESVELQVLLLLKVRGVVIEPEQIPSVLRSIRGAYDRFLAKRFPDTPPVSLASRLRDEEQGDLTEILADFIREIVTRQDAHMKPNIHQSQRYKRGSINNRLDERNRTPSQQRPAAPFFPSQSEAA